MTYIFAAAGTGGHIVPALAVAQALTGLRPGARVLFLGTGRELESRLIEGEGYPLVHLPAFPWRGSGLIGKLKLAASFPRAVHAAQQIYRRERPRAVIGFGGYPSVAPIVAAAMSHIPVFLQEQNGEVGVANRILSLFARRIFAAPGATGFLSTQRVLEVPNPVCPEFTRIPDLATEGRPLRVLVLGGSQGAVTLNEAIIELLPTLREYEIVHQTGSRDFERVRDAYGRASFTPVRLFPFTDDVARELSEAHIVICRAGAMTVAEVTAAGRPAIFIPLEIAGAHQWANVKHVVESGAGFAVRQGTELPSELRRLIGELSSSPERLTAVGRSARGLARGTGGDAAEVIAKAVIRES